MARRFFLFFQAFLLLVSQLSAQNTNTLCLQAYPFCTDENPYGITYPAGTSSEDTPDLPYDSYGCLGSTPSPAWYVMQINHPGDMLIYMTHSGGYDIDFACWGPFTGYGSYSQVLQAVCTSQLYGDGSSHRPDNGYHNPNDPSTWGGYPDGTLIDCSYTAQSTEWCYIPNAQTGQWYIFLICNYSEMAGNISFSVQSGTATTDCSITAPITGDEVCEGQTATLVAQPPPNAVQYLWTGPNNFAQITTSNILTIPYVTMAQAGTYSVQVWNGSSYGNTTTCQLIVHPNPILTVSATSTSLCQGESATITSGGAETYLWSTGSTASSITVSPTASTTYTVTGTNGGMCTATSSITVNVYPHYNFTFNESICQGSGYNDHGVTLTAAQTNTPGTYDFTNNFQTQHNCDSIITLHLTINPAATVNRTATICQGESYTLGNQTYTTSGTYTYTSQTLGGCDSVIILDLTVYPAYNQEETIDICETELPYYYAVEDVTFPVGTTSGDHLYAHQTIHGCDSNRTLHLRVHSDYDFTFNETICQGSGYNAHGVVLSAAETEETGTFTYAHTYQSAYGCDSSVTVNLTINPITTVNLVAEICQGESYTLGNQSHTTSGTYTYTTQGSNGCDSTTVVDLTVHPTYNQEESVSICISELPYYYAADDTTFAVGTTSGVYRFHYQTVNGCDSTRTLRLSVNPEYDIVKNITICSSKLPYHYGPLDITFDETSPAESTHHQYLTTRAGCDSNITTNVTIIDDALTLENLTPDLCEENRAVLHVTTSLQNIQWSTGERNTDEITITHGGVFIVSASTEPCRNSAQLYIEPCKLYVYLPNAITPTLHDGVNDVFCLPDFTANQMMRDGFEIMIFDRWGMLVYRSEDPHFRWNGTIKGKIAANNTFTYVMNYKDLMGMKYVKKGWLSVL